MKKVIVTGANGFVGSWFLKELSKNNIEIIAVVKNHSSNIDNISLIEGVTIVYCELSNISNLHEIIKERDFDTFYHLAWEGSTGVERKNYKKQLLNVNFSCDAAKVAKELGCERFLVSGTITEKIAENILNLDVKAENTIYGIAKHTTHNLLDVICNNLGIKYVWMRFSNVYGPNNFSGNIISYLLQELLKNNTPTFSKAEQPYDLVYVEDLVYAMYLLGDSDLNNSCYFLGSGSPQLLKNYLIKTKNIFDKNAIIGLGERKDDGLVYNKEWFDISSLVNDTGFKSKFTFEEGMTKTINWIKSITNDKKI